MRDEGLARDVVKHLNRVCSFLFFTSNIKIYNNENNLGQYLQATLLTLQERCHEEQNTMITPMAIT